MQLNALIGKKVYQKQGFLQDGRRVPLSGLVVAGNVVTQIKSTEKEGYNSIQLGIETKKKLNKAMQGHSQKALETPKTASKEQTTDNQNPTSSPVSAGASQANSSAKASSVPKVFREVRLDDTDGAVLGSQIDVSEVFAPGDIIDVTGVSKGKGWAGGVKRYHFKGGPKTHGQSDRHRAPGSIGQGTTPGRVYKGKKMAGRMGSDTVTVKNLEVIEITDDGVLLIKGLVPGRINGILLVKKTGENKKFVPLFREIEEVEEAPTEVQPKQEEAQASDSQPVEEKQTGESVGSSFASEDASQAKEETQSSEPAQLSESQPTVSEENQKIRSEAALDSSESAQPSAAQEKDKKESSEEESPVEKKEDEVKEKEDK